MLSVPERFLKQVGPQIAYLPITVSRSDLAMHSLSRGGRPFFPRHSRHWRADSAHHVYAECSLQQPVASLTASDWRGKASLEQHGFKAPLSTMTSRGISSLLQRVMKPTFALTDFHVDIGQLIFDDLLLIGCQTVDLILARNFCQLCPIRCRSHLPYAHA